MTKTLIVKSTYVHYAETQISDSEYSELSSRDDIADELSDTIAEFPFNWNDAELISCEVSEKESGKVVYDQTN